MNDEVKKEIIKIREELEKKKKKIKSIPGLIKQKIDREYPLDFNELSESELEAEMGKRVVFLNENLNIINKINQKTGNKLMKILLIIPYLIHIVFTKPLPIMKNYLQLNHLLLIRLKRVNERLDRLEGQLKEMEGMQELLIEKKEV